EGHGEPDAIEVLGGRYQPKDIALVYKRTGRRIVVESTSDGWVARAPEALPGARRSTRQARAQEAPPPGPPTTAQALECPIDPMRPDCQALCAAEAEYQECPGHRDAHVGRARAQLRARGRPRCDPRSGAGRAVDRPRALGAHVLRALLRRRRPPGLSR